MNVKIWDLSILHALACYIGQIPNIHTFFVFYFNASLVVYILMSDDPVSLVKYKFLLYQFSTGMDFMYTCLYNTIKNSHRFWSNFSYT